MNRPSRTVRVEREVRGNTGVAPDVVRVELFGGFRVSVGARIIGEDGWRLRKARSLVALLALEPGRRMHRERMMDLLWPRLDARAAANNLRYTLHVARRVLDSADGSQYLAHEGDLLVLSPGARSWVDVEAFEEAVATARRLREPAAYRAALDLYAGDLLPQDRYEEWAEDRREGLRRLRLDVLVESARLHEERGEPAPAMEALRRVVQEDRSHEAAHAGLRRLRALAGRGAEASSRNERPLRSLSREPEKGLGDAGMLARIPPPLKESRERSGRLHNLPAPRTSFVGRERELVEVGRLLSMTRLLTLTGAGGSGKTRLALEVAERFVDVYPDGVWLVELASLSDGALAPQAFAGALGVREQPGRPLAETLADTLRERSLLLIVDNCEHLVDEAARLVEGTLDACPGLRVLATSREVLGVAGELAWRVPSLSLPDPRRPPTVPELALHGASRLFVERARLYRPGFMLTAENGRAVAEICHRLDGIPLAIELAAARVGVLSAAQISERLGDSLDLLTGGSRTATPRHQTLRGALDWSHELLAEPERRLFARLSVFAGGLSLEAAETVGAGAGIAGGEVLDLLSSLVDKSLVVAETPPGDGGAPRFRLLEPVRQYGSERLAESGEAEVVGRFHAHHFLDFAQEIQPAINGAERAASLARLGTEHGNLRAALRWSVRWREARIGLQLANALLWFWFHAGHWSEGRGWFEELLGLPESPEKTAERAEVLTGAGILHWVQGDHDSARSLLEQSVVLWRELGGGQGLVQPLQFLSMEMLGRGETATARTLAEESVRIARQGRNGFDLAMALANLGLVAHTQHNHAAVRPILEECAEVCRRIGDAWLLSLPYRHLGYIELRLGNHDRALAYFKEGLASLAGLGEKWFVARAVEAVAIAAAVRGEAPRAVRLFGAGEALREAVGASVQEFYRADYDRGVAAARDRLDARTWRAAWEEGRAMTTEEAMEHARTAGEGPAPPETSAPEERPLARALTPRESEVAALVSRGLSNRQIASKLVISERTVNAHLRKIFKKLKLHSRAQLAAWAAMRGLMGQENPS